VDEAVLFANKVLVLSARPATVLEEVEIKLDYPRDPTSPKFHEYWVHLTRMLQQELEKTFDRESSMYKVSEERLGAFPA
jgi:NitT/TauT family transport system ATP-binding protein